LTVYPGSVDALSTFSWERVADKVRANDPRVEAARGAGFTSAMTFPNNGIFAGQGAVMNLGDARPSRLIVQAPVGQYISLSVGGGRGFPSSLMGVIAYIRQCYIDLDYYRQAKAAYDKDPKGRMRPEYDRALEGLAESPRLLFPAVSLSEIDRVLRFAKELKQPAVLYGLHEGFRATELLKAAGMPVIVSTKWPTRVAGTG